MKELWELYDLERLQEGVDSFFPGYDISLEILLDKLMKGDLSGAFGSLWEGVAGGLAAQAAGMWEVLVWLLVLGISSALLGYFVDIFEKKQVADLGFYVMYLLLGVVLLKCFEQAARTTEEAIEGIVLFMKLLMPAYLVAVGVAAGTVTVSSYYQLMLLLIYGVQQVLGAVVVPMIYTYCLLALVNGIWIEQRLALFMTLLAKGIRGILKTSIGLVTGISVFQAALAPAVDAVQSNVLKRIVSFLPGIGNAAEGLADLVVGSAVLIRNAIGAAAVVLLAVLCIVPLFRIFLISCILKLAAACMGVVSDRRLTACTDQIGEGSMMLCRTAGTAFLLFAITISVVAISVNRGI